MYINHNNAKKEFRTIINNEGSNWIVLSGGELSGKSSFIKEVCSVNKTIFLENKFNVTYITLLSIYIRNNLEEYVIEFFYETSHIFSEIKEKFKISFIGDMYNINIEDVIKFLLTNDYNFEYAKYLGCKMSKKYCYVVLDDFYKCDDYSYNWLRYFAESFLNNQRYIIAICDYEKIWNSDKVYNIFRNIPSFINIQKFENCIDYFNVLKQNIFFDNYEKLKKISNRLFNLYDGNAQLLFKTIKIYNKDIYYNDNQRSKMLNKISNNFSINDLKTSNKMEQLVLELIALLPTDLSKKDISIIMDTAEDIIQDILLNLFNKGLLIYKNNTLSGQVGYRIFDNFIRNQVLDSIDSKNKDFLLNRVLQISISKEIAIPIENIVDISLTIKSEAAEMLLYEFLNTGAKITDEKKIKYINRLYLYNLHKSHIFSTYDNALLAYEIGYFKTALKMLTSIQYNGKRDYNYYMLLGGVQHLLLLDEAPKTFEIASTMSDITISQKLSAINRQIMSLNQADNNSAKIARKLYDQTLEQYSHVKCDGLIELLRNTNNSYPMKEALDYTIKGYLLAIDLDNKIEQYKCIHNICMIKLHQNIYKVPLNNLKIECEPSFEMVDDFFKSNPIYNHKRAYPLLDLGTYEMLEYVSKGKHENLLNAKKYYSKAQLFAKSFYAVNIAEMALLIVNTHLYKDDSTIIETIKAKRNDIYINYKKANIVDHRVNRKILLSLAVSSLLTNDVEETKKYLFYVEPYISGKEKQRYYNLKKACENNINQTTDSEDFETIYFASVKVVPWLISFGH